MLEGKGRFHSRKGGKTTHYTIHISTKVAEDSAFPFVHKDKLHIKIEDDKLIITREGEKNGD